MVTGFYAVLLTALMFYLAFKVIKVRRKEQIKYANGDSEELARVRTAQLNAYENIPFFLVLMMILELNLAPIILLHIIAIIMLLGRSVHAFGILKNKLNCRVIGMGLTFTAIMATSIANLVYLPWYKIFGL